MAPSKRRTAAKEDEEATAAGEGGTEMEKWGGGEVDKEATLGCC